MKLIAKRSLAWILSLLMVIGLLSGMVLTTSAETVNYVYSGQYIYNWGSRDTVATFLSPNAIKFYEDNNVTYEQLAAYAGSNTTSGVPSSNLYKQLQTLMKNNHTHETSYNETRDLFRYTDCQNSGSPVSISSFYSGKSIGPAWDGGSTWNREHTWPNSKGDASGNGENDIIMLRPTSSSENSSRGNKAYGEGSSTSYYDPNQLGQNVRGDVARIMLFVYVRWGNTGKMWGSSGVMESKDILLKWMEEDPVDTWELGRNDSTEAITGTRNVFVDYPELAFELFETAMPQNYQTPSGEATDGNQPNNPDQPDIPTPDQPGTDSGIVTDPQVGVAYKLGLDNGTSVYYATGEMSGYYGATETSVDAAADVYLESANGGYHMYVNTGSKKYINLVYTGTHYNFTYDSAATSVYTVDTAKNALCTVVNNETCYIGTYGTYVTMGVLRSSMLKDSDYIARLYGAGGSSTPDTPVTPPTEDPTPNTYLTIAEAVALGSTKSKDVYTEGKYYVTGTIKNVDNAVFGNMTLTDGKGNDLYVYGTYSADGKVGYSGLNPKPVVGDTVTLYGAIGMYNEPQMKGGWFVAHIPGSNPDQPSVSGSALLDFSDKANRTTLSTAQQVWEQNGIKLVNDKASSTTNVADYASPARFYKSSSVTITYPGMRKLVITAADGSAYNKDYASPWADSFSDNNATATVNSADCTVTIVFASPVDSFTWTSMSNQARAYSIEVFDGSEDTSHTHEYDSNCDDTCNTCDAIRIANHVYDDNVDTTCNNCGATREVSVPQEPDQPGQPDQPVEPDCNHIWINGICDLCGEASPSKVTITTQPKTATYGKDEDVVDVTVKAEGEGLKYQWYFRNENATDYTASSMVSDTYSAMVTDLTHNRRLYCIITDKYGNQVRTTTVLIRRQVTLTGESATASYAKKGASVKASVSAIGDDLKFTWYIKNDGASKYSKSSVTKSTYSVAMSDKVNNRRAYCIITDKYGKTVKSKTFIFRETVSITTQPKNAKAAMGASAKLTVKASGEDLKYTWYIKNEGATKYSKSSVTKSTYSVTMSDKVKNRRVYCVITDKYGNKVQTQTCIIREAVSITTQPKNAKVAMGKTAKVTVKASGDDLKYTWYVKNADATKYSKSSITKSSYSVKMSSKVKGRRVYCIVTDKYGNKVQTQTVILKTP